MAITTGCDVTEVRSSKDELEKMKSGGLTGLSFLVASGFTGQTLETLELQGEAAPFERPVGVRLPSYAGLFLTYRFGKLAPK
jgi:hypothetical protein